MNIVFVTPELAPVAKVGGLADVAASLPRALERLGHRVAVLTSRYRGIDAVRATGAKLTVEMDGKPRAAALSKAVPRLNGVETFFIENDDYFTGRSIYGEGGEDYADNAYRFAFFARAVAPAASALGLEPDLYHVHDWQTALMPVYQRVDRVSPRLPVVLTVHNLAYQGVYPHELLPGLGLPDELFHMEGLEFYGKINFLKGGLVTADRITTVSPTYAREIQTEQMGAGLEGVIRSRAV